MYLRVNKTSKGSYMILCNKYRDRDGKIKDQVVESIGYVHDFQSQFPDPIAHFRQVARDRTQALQEQKKAARKTLSIDMNQEMESDEDTLRNVGYGLFKRLYQELELSTFWRKITRGMNIDFDADKIFQLLVYSRILFPASKRKTYQNRKRFFEDFGDFSLDDVYKALTIFGHHETELQKWIYDHSVTKYHRDLETVFFDCTNYYYDISKPDVDDLDDEGNVTLQRYRKYGPEKNHRKDPIVELGLLMDNTGIPLAYDLFPGNESEKVHMLPIIRRMRSDYGIGRVIVVADRGLNTSDNIFKLNGRNTMDNNPLDGYVYGQSVRGADSEFKKWVLDQSGYKNTAIDPSPENKESEDTGSMEDKIIFRHKSRIYPKKIQITREYADGHTGRQSITVDQKQLVYYSDKYAKKQKLERDRAVERAKDLIAHPKKYDRMTAKGSTGYVKNLSFDKNTGEVIDKNLELDTEKIKEEEKYDGYYSIVTSELKMDDLKIREVYRGLIRIEDTFRITKSEFDTRPIFVRTNEHIDAHFTECFTALVLIRLLQLKLTKKYPVGQILESLRKYNCISLENGDYEFIFRNEIIDECAASFGINLSTRYRSREDMRRILKY